MKLYVIDGNKGKGKEAATTSLIDNVQLGQIITSDWKEERRERFIAANETEWADVGNGLQSARVERGISLASAARLIGFSTSTLRRFEKGQPVQNAKVIERSYGMMVTIHDLKSRLIAAYEEIDGLADADQEIPESILRFSMDVMGRPHEVRDYDYKRIYIDADGEEFLIVKWDFKFQTGDFKWTLSKIVRNPDGSSHGEEVKSGSANFKQFSN